MVLDIWDERWKAPVGEAHPLQHEAPRGLHASGVAAPVQQPGRAEVLEDVQALAALMSQWRCSLICQSRQYVIMCIA